MQHELKAVRLVSVSGVVPDVVPGDDDFAGAVIANVIFTMYAFVFTDSLWALAASVPIHGICWAITKYDAHAFRIIGLWLSHTAETLGSRPTWRASSRAPYPKRRF